MATNKQIQAIKTIAKRWGFITEIHNPKTHREAIVYRGYFK